MSASRLVTLLLAVAVCASPATSAAANPQSDHLRLSTPTLRYEFGKYLNLDDHAYYKVFVLARDSTWSWSRNSSYEDAVRQAMASCNSQTRFLGSCRLFAVGNEIVWDMSEHERQNVIGGYREGREFAGKDIAKQAEERIPRDGLDPYLDYPDSSGFKVFFLAGDSAWAWAWRTTFEAAFRDAQALCERSGISRRCELAAIGDTLVLEMSPEQKDAVIESYSGTVGRLAPMRGSALKAFEKYKLHDEAHGFKAFFVGDDGSWSYLSRPSVSEARKTGMEGCLKHLRRGNCYLYALGNTIVWGMDDNELNEIISRYEELNLPFESFAPSDTRKFDGTWTGLMHCDDCPNCNGMVEKRLSLIIGNGRFEIVPDLTYFGIGRVNSTGMVSVWSKRDFRFDGHAKLQTIRLHGQRGVRSCRIDLERKNK